MAFVTSRGRTLPPACASLCADAPRRPSTSGRRAACTTQSRRRDTSAPLPPRGFCPDGARRTRAAGQDTALLDSGRGFRASRQEKRPHAATVSLRRRTPPRARGDPRAAGSVLTDGNGPRRVVRELPHPGGCG